MTGWRWLQIGGLAAAILLISIVSGMRAPVLPEIGQEFGATAAQLGYIGSAFGLGRLLADLPAGALANRISPTWLLAGSALFMAGGALLMATSPVFLMMVVGAAVMGAGSGVMTTVSMVVFSRLGTRENRGRYMAIYQASNLGGQSVGPVLGGVVAALTEWRTALASGVAACGMAAVLAVPARTLLLGEKQSREGEGQESDSPLSMLALFAVPVAIFFSLTGFQQTVVPLYASGELHLGPGEIGLALGIAGVVRFVGSIVTGVLSDRFGRKSILLFGLLTQAVASLLLIFANSFLALTASLIFLSAVSSGVTVGATMLGDLKGSRAGTSIGAYRFVGDVGNMAGPWVLGALYGGSGVAASALVNAAVFLATAAAVWRWVPETRWVVPGQAKAP